MKQIVSDEDAFFTYRVNHPEFVFHSVSTATYDALKTAYDAAYLESLQRMGIL